MSRDPEVAELKTCHPVGCRPVSLSSSRLAFSSFLAQMIAHLTNFCPTSTTPQALEDYTKNDCNGCLFGGSERALEEDRISPLESNRQALE